MIQLDPRLTLPPGATGVAIIGCGYWGMNYVRVFSEMPDCRVVSVCDPREQRLIEIARRYREVGLTIDAEEVLSDPSVEAVVVAVEAQGHFDLARRALLADKHVLVEKPLTTTVEEADELIALAEERERLLLVGHTFIYNGGVRKMRELIRTEEIGHLYYVYSRRTSLGPIRNDVNAIWDLAPHDVAIFNYLLAAAPQWVSAVGAKVLENGNEDVGFISLGYPNGVVGHIHVSWTDPNKVREVVAVGSRKRVLFNDLDPLERVKVFDKGVARVPDEEPANYGEFHLLLRDGDITSPAIGVSEPLKNQCGHFLHCIRRGEQALTTGVHGRETVRVMQAIGKSMAQSGAPVQVARPSLVPKMAIASGGPA